MYYINKYFSALGPIVMASDDNTLIGLWFEGQKHFNNELLSNHKEADIDIFKVTKNWLDIYFQGDIPDFTPNIKYDTGSKFQILVWEILRQIPYGRSTTYGEIAKLTAKKMNKQTMSAQAIGGAIGRNPISIIIPCHRVLGSDGRVTGYAGGFNKKRYLLSIEGIEYKKEN